VTGVEDVTDLESDEEEPAWVQELPEKWSGRTSTDLPQRGKCRHRAGLAAEAGWGKARPQDAREMDAAPQENVPWRSGWLQAAATSHDRSWRRGRQSV